MPEIQVRTLVQNRMNEEQSHKTILLTGPCGCGKATSVKLLAKELGIDMLEFDDASEFDLDSSGQL